MTQREIMLTCLFRMACHVEIIIKHEQVFRLLASLRYKLIRLCSDVQMLQWFAEEQPGIWPIEMRNLVYRGDEQPGYYWMAESGGYKPASDLAQQIFRLRTDILRAAAAACDVPWDTSNDAALFVGLHNLELRATRLIRVVDKALEEEADGGST